VVFRANLNERIIVGENPINLPIGYKRVI